MKNIRHYLIALAAIFTILSTVSCEKDETLAYSETEICNIVNGRILADSGYYFNIVESGATIPNLTSYERIVVVCDILRKTEGKENEYDIRLLDAYKVTISSPLNKSYFPEDTKTDAVGVQAAWFGGGYLNVNIQYTMVKESKVNHDIALVYNDVKSNKDTVYLEMYHNAHNESYEYSNIEANKISVVGDYLAYPIEKIIPAGTEKTVVNIKWKWFLTQEGYLIRDTYTSDGNIIYDKNEK